MEKNKQYQQIIDEAYNPYFNKAKEMTTAEVFSRALSGVGEIIEGMLQPFTRDFIPYTQEQFVNKCKIDEKFSDKWGLKIEERELSLEERHELALPIWKEKYGPLADMMVPTNVDNTPYKIPTKLITVTYKNKTIEVYE